MALSELTAEARPGGLWDAFATIVVVSETGRQGVSLRDSFRVGDWSGTDSDFGVESATSSRSELFVGRSKKAYLLWFSLLCFVSPAVPQTQEETAPLSKPTAPPSSEYSAPAADSTLGDTNVPVAELIDDLVNIDAQAPGLHSTALFSAFIADNSPAEFEEGIIGSAAPKSFPQMTELVRRGVSSLPLLIKHLDDKRPTKLTVGGEFFMFEYFQ